MRVALISVLPIPKPRVWVKAYMYQYWEGVAWVEPASMHIKAVGLSPFPIPIPKINQYVRPIVIQYYYNNYYSLVPMPGVVGPFPAYVIVIEHGPGDPECGRLGLPLSMLAW